MSNAPLQATILAAGNAAKIALESAGQLIVLCHKQRSHISLLAAYHSLNAALDCHVQNIDRVRSILQHYPGGAVQLGEVCGASVIEVCWGFARRVFLTAMSGLQCSYAEHQIESQRNLSFEQWSDKHAAPSSLHDAAIRDVIKTHYPSADVQAIRAMVDIELDREVARVSSDSGCGSAVSPSVSDGSGETVTVNELAILVGRNGSTIAKRRRVSDGPDWRVLPLGVKPGRMDFREAMDWARSIWTAVDYPRNRAELEQRIRPK